MSQQALLAAKCSNCRSPAEVVTSVMRDFATKKCRLSHQARRPPRVRGRARRARRRRALAAARAAPRGSARPARPRPSTRPARPRRHCACARQRASRWRSRRRSWWPRSSRAPWRSTPPERGALRTTGGRRPSWLTSGRRLGPSSTTLQRREAHGSRPSSRRRLGALRRRTPRRARPPRLGPRASSRAPRASS